MTTVALVYTLPPAALAADGRTDPCRRLSIRCGRPQAGRLGPAWPGTRRVPPIRHRAAPVLDRDHPPRRWSRGWAGSWPATSGASAAGSRCRRAQRATPLGGRCPRISSPWPSCAPPTSSVPSTRQRFTACGGWPGSIPTPPPSAASASLPTPRAHRYEPPLVVLVRPTHVATDSASSAAVSLTRFGYRVVVLGRNDPPARRTGTIGAARVLLNSATQPAARSGAPHRPAATAATRRGTAPTGRATRPVRLDARKRRASTSRYCSAGRNRTSPHLRH
jgi:hypothetical protein